MSHVDANVGNGPVEKTIKLLLQMGLKSAKAGLDGQVDWKEFLT
jgi:hypothetical protein